MLNLKTPIERTSKKAIRRTSRSSKIGLTEDRMFSISKSRKARLLLLSIKCLSKTLQKLRVMKKSKTSFRK